jgi:hypothetical protein
LPLVMQGDGREGFGVGEVLGGQGQAQLGPVVLQDEEQLGGGQVSGIRGRSRSCCRAGVPGEAFFDARHADQDHAERLRS